MKNWRIFSSQVAGGSRSLSVLTFDTGTDGDQRIEAELFVTDAFSIIQESTGGKAGFSALIFRTYICAPEASEKDG